MARIQQQFPAEHVSDARSYAREKLLAAGLATVQPWLDIPELGSAVIVVTDKNAPLAKESANYLATALWLRRRDYLGELVSAPDAVRTAFELYPGGNIHCGWPNRL